MNTETRRFTCFMCQHEFTTTGPAIEHYKEAAPDEEIVSLCDQCTKDAQERAIELGLQNEVSEGFFVSDAESV